MFLLREFELYPNEGAIFAEPFGMEGGTEGRDYEDAAKMAADWLRGEAQWRLIRGETMPAASFDNEPEHGGRILLVGIETSLEDVPSMSAAEAATALGVSRPRVSQMLASGSLVGWRDGRNTRVTRESVEARLAERPRTGKHGEGSSDDSDAPAAPDKQPEDEREPWITMLARESHKLGGVELEIPEREPARDFHFE